MSISLRFALGLTASTAALPVFAASSALEPDEVVVVTATGIGQPLATVGDSITVLQPEQIRASQKRIASDLLSRVPGVAVTRNGGIGGVTSLRIRGAESEQTVVLFDGIKLNDPSATGSGYNFANLVLDDESRIEVLRGPQSTLWGSQAIGGVVNIVTAEPRGPLSSTLTAEMGGRESGFTRVRIQDGGEKFAWRAGASYLTTEGVSSFDEDLGGRERDSYRNLGAHLRASYAFNDAVSAEVRAMYSDGENEFDGFPPPAFSFTDTEEYGETRDLVSYGGIKIAAPGGRWTHRLGYAFTATDRQNFNPAQAVTRTTFKADGQDGRAEYFGTFAITPAYLASFGLESTQSEFSTAAPSAFDPSPAPIRRDVRLDGAYVQMQATPIEALTLTAGARRDDHETFGGATTARGSVAWSVTADTILRASYGEGFKAPSLYQLYSEFGNTALQPEEGDGWDAGIEQRFADGKVSFMATYFRRDTDNMIDFFSCFGSSDPRCAAQPFGFYENIAQTKADGVELGLAAQFTRNLLLNVNYTRLDTENVARGSVNFERELPRRPKDTLNADLSYVWPLGVTTTVAVQQVGRSFDNASNSIRLDAYTLVDLRVDYAMSEKLHFFARLENAFDEDYRTTANYGSVGQTAYGGVRFSF
jgi:vitamin B12 transporter